MELNLNNNLEENYNHALNLCESELTHEGLINLLQSENVAERQFAALTINSLAPNEINIFMRNLTGCDGKIREAIASRLEEFLTAESAVHFTPFFETFADATIDINANISRMVIDALKILKSNEEFGSNYSAILVRFLNEAFDEIAKIKFRDKKYVLNKQLFKMYWALEGLSEFYSYVDKTTLKNILAQILERPEYTIREKAAEIVIRLMPNDDFTQLFDRVSQDENFYVKRVAENLKETK